MSKQTAKLVEIHMIQNHSPGNMNRDDLGAPKTCIFGGVPRSRVSSQCIKRSIRNPGNPDDIHNREPGYFAQEMAAHMGTRTKRFPWLVERALENSAFPKEERRRIVKAAQRIAKTKEKDESKRTSEPTTDDRAMTPQLIFLRPHEAEAFIRRLQDLKNEDKGKDKYEYFLNPIVGFQEIVESYLGDLDDKEKERIVKSSWVIAKCRMKDVLKAAEGEEETPEPPLEDGQPGEGHARAVAEQLLELRTSNPERYKALLTKPSEKEKTSLKGDAPAKPKGMREFRERLKTAMGVSSVDIALFGRMTTSDAFEDVEAAMQVAHAISTHRAVNEVDYFTAMDDLRKGAAAAHLGEGQIVSACFYKYFCLDWDQLVHNLAGPEPKEEDSDEQQRWARDAKPAAERLAAATLGHFLVAAAETVPSGKKNSSAHFNFPDGILVEIKEKKRPVSYANAFAVPVPEKCPRGLIGESIACLGQYVHEIAEGYGLNAERWWFSPDGRYPLNWVDRNEKEEYKKDKPVVADGDHNLTKLDALVRAMVKAATGLDWDAVKDAGKAEGEEPRS